VLAPPEQGTLTCPGHARELAVLLALPPALAAQKTSLRQGLFPAVCPLSAARVLPKAPLLFPWTASRTLDVAWSFLLDGFLAGSFVLSL